MAVTSSLNCLFCRVPYTSLHALNALPSFSEKALLFTDFCFVASPSQKSVPISADQTYPRVSVPLFSCFGKIQKGAHKRGLTPQTFRENRGEILPGKSGLFGAIGAFSGPIGAFSGPIGTNSSAPHSRGKSRNCPEGALFGPIGAFQAKPRLLSPSSDFPKCCLLATLAAKPLSGNGAGSQVIWPAVLIIL